MHHSNRKSPDKAALDPSLLFSSCIHKPDVDHVVYCMFVFNVFLLKYKHVFCVFYSKIYVLATMARIASTAISGRCGLQTRIVS